MKCEAVNRLLDNFVIGRLPESEANEVSGHLRGCRDCQQAYLDTRMVVDAMQGLTVPAASDGFADRVIRNAVRTGGYQPVRLLSYVASGIAASFVFLFVLAFTMLDPQDSTPASPIVLIGDEIKTVKLAIESARAVDGINMTIDLSDNLQVVGYENQKTISWDTRLEKGTNVIALPISAIARGNGEIKARVEFKGNEKIFIFDTRYEPGNAGSSGYLKTKIIKT